MLCPVMRLSNNDVLVLCFLNVVKMPEQIQECHAYDAQLATRLG